MGICYSGFRKRRPRGDEREPLLPRHTPEIPPQSQFDKAADILAALSAGKYPSQDQINRAFRLLLSSDILKSGRNVPSGPLSQHGQKVLDDIRTILQALISLGMEKNGDDRIQDLLWHAGHIEEVPVKMSMTVNAAVSLGLEEGASKLPPGMTSQEELSQDVRRVASSVWSLITLLITSGAFRLVLSDILVTARDVLADIAEDIAKLASIIEVRAEQVEAAVRPTDTELAAIKDQEGNAGVSALEDHVKVGQSMQERTTEATSTGVGSRARHKSTWDGLENKSPDRIRETALNRITEIVEQAQASPRYTASLATIANLSSKYIKKLAFTAEAVGDAASATASNVEVLAEPSTSFDADLHLKQALEDIKVLVERFSGHRLDLLGDKITLLLRDFSSRRTRGEDSLPTFVDSAREWVQRALLQPGWIRTNPARKEGGELYDRLFDLLRKEPKVIADAKGVLEELFVLRDALAEDRSTNSLLSTVHTLLSDVGSMSHVGVQVMAKESTEQWEAVKAELCRDVVSWVLPRVLSVLRTVPLPRVELMSDALDVVVDKMTLASPSFIPDYIRVTNHTDFLLRASYLTTDAYFETSTSTRTRVAIGGLRFSVENIAYYLNAKGPFWTGWLDNGLLTMDVGGKRIEGDGISIILDIEVPSQGRDEGNDLFRVLDAKVDIPGLAFSLNQTRHWIFNTLVTQPLLGPLVRMGISSVLSAQIKASLEALNSRLCCLRDKARAVHGGKSSPLTIEDYWEAFTRSRQEELHTSAPRPSVGDTSPSPDQETRIRTETEATTKGIIRTTITENAEGETESETLLAIGIGEQILPGLGGPVMETAPTLVDHGREALDDLNQLQKGEKGRVNKVMDGVLHSNEIISDHLFAAGARVQKQRHQFADLPDWKSSVFDL